MNIQDRPYQRQAVESIQQLYSEGKNRQLASWATGAGKTWLIAKIPYLINPHKKTLVIVHTEELMKQAKEKIERWNPGLHVGVEMGRLTSSEEHQVIIGSVQTLGNKNGKRLAKLKPEEFGAIVTDECHHAAASGYLRIFQHFGVWGKEGQALRSDILQLGVTATPYRTDKVGLKAVYDEIATEYTMLDGIRDNYLTDIRAFRVRSTVSLDQVKVTAGDLQQDQLAAAVNNRARNELIVNKWAEIAPERKTVVFTVNIAHAKDIAAVYQERGYKFEAIWGTDPERESKIERLHSGELQGLCNAMLLTEGFDCPDISCIVLARPTSSRLVYVQEVGRGVRPSPETGKIDCLVLDITDNTVEHDIVSAASLAGLPNNVMIDGLSLEEMAAQAEKAGMTERFEKLTQQQLLEAGNRSFDQLEAYLQEVELFSVPQEVENNSKLNWIKVQDQKYVMSMPNEKIMTIEYNNGTWDMAGSAGGTTFGDKFDSLKQAMNFADRNLKRFDASTFNHKKRDGDEAWRQKPATIAQKKWLKYSFTSNRMPVPNMDSMTFGTASKLLDKFNAQSKAERMSRTQALPKREPAIQS